MKKKIFAIVIGLLPGVAFAAVDAFSILATVSRILNTIIPILITLGVVYFIWGVIKYVTAKDPDAQKEARSVMISGIIGLFVIVSIWGLVNLISNTFGVGGGAGAPPPPSVSCPSGQTYNYSLGYCI